MCEQNEAEKQTYRNFLKQCQKDGIVVWADCHLQNEKKTIGHWNGDHITVARRKKKQERFCLLMQSSDKKIDEFIEDSPDINSELAILLHEYGHWKCKHPHLLNVTSEVGYQQEVEAWEIGKKMGVACGIRDFSIFDKQRDQALKSYRDGLGLK